MGKMSVIIPDEVVYATHLTTAEFLQEVAIHLYQRDKLTLGQASRLAGMSQRQFQCLPSSREIPVHHDVAEFEADLNTLREMGRL